MLDLLNLQKYFLLSHIKEGDIVADFTMGNGHDTAFLSKAVGESGKVFAFDIQQTALKSTEKTLKTEGCPDNCSLFLLSHDRAKEVIDCKIKAGVFNLGYLPGGGNKELTTMRKTTMPAVAGAVDMLDDDGILLVAVYPGHAEGALEGEELTGYLSTISRFDFTIAEIRIVNSPESPYFFTVEKNPRKKKN